MVISQEYADVPVGDRAMRTFVAAPRAPGSYPGVVFYSDIFQLTESTLRWCMRLAGYGFVVAAPEIYHRIEPAGTVLGFDDDGKLGKDTDAGSLARASEIGGEMLLIFGTNDPHTPEDGRAVIKRGLEDAGVSFRW